LERVGVLKNVTTIRVGITFFALALHFSK